MADNKPTIEELKAQEEEAIKLAEEIEKNGIPEEPEETEPPVIPNEVIPEPVVEEEPQADPSEEAKLKLKEKLSASARENQKIYAKNRVINQALTDADEIPEPTEEDLVKEFPDWDVMSETERTFAKETVISRNWRQTISKAKEQATKIEKWNDSVEDFAEDPKTLIDNPELEGKTDKFKEFATREDNNSVPFKTLVGAFLYEDSKNKVSHKGQMFETGSGGLKETPILKSDKISLEEARVLRETDYSKYKEYLVAGKIDTNI